VINLPLEAKFTTENSVFFFENTFVRGVIAPDLRGLSFVENRDREQTRARERNFIMISTILGTRLV
jgi:hypothetical protein